MLNKKKLYFTNYIFFYSDMSTLCMANWILFIWDNRYYMDFVVADAVSGN